jgi:hypothetical protein
MTTSTSTRPDTDAATDDPVASSRRRVVAMALWGAAFLAAWLLIGLPTDPAYAFFWLWAATFAWNSHRPWRSHLGFARDWSPVVVLLLLYNLSRGFADNNATPHALELAVADRAMWGWATGGQLPTLWLQSHLFDPDHVHWWDVLVSWIYFSHFVMALIVAVVLWLRDRPSWAAFVRRWVTLSVLGLITYFAYPAAPPWWAGRYGLISEVARLSTRGWRAIGLHGAGNLLNAGQVAANPVAAMPSLHTAFALLVVAFFLPRVRRRWWPLLLLYPLGMVFTLVYTGEHWVIDALFGWLYVGITFLLVGLGERGWAARRARRSRSGPPPAAPQGRAGAAPQAHRAESPDQSPDHPAQPVGVAPPAEVRASGPTPPAEVRPAEARPQAD